MNIGFIGLGSMGSGMAQNLVSHGFKVIGFDVDQNRLDTSMSFQAAQNTEEMAKICEVVIICLPNPETSRKVIFDQLTSNDSSLQTIIETSTLTPEIVTEFSQKLQEKGFQFLSAPMIGGKNHAAEGTVEFLIEGSEEVFSEYKALFEAMGKSSRFMGAIPSATLAKLSFNLSRYANLAVGVETDRLLSAYEANKPAIHEFMSEQSQDNFGQVWAEDLEEMMKSNVAYQPSQVPKKDLALLMQMAKEKGLDRELISAIRNTYLKMEEER
jgi:3-hydroxyisobutyrate dehydrogenase-like beta-hydroxyacid dehydrogenase